MTKGTPSFGRKSGKRNNMKCRRCGKNGYHKVKQVCSSCGYGKSSKIRKYAWMKKKRSKKKKNLPKL